MISRQEMLYESIQQAHQATGIPVAVLKAAKKDRLLGDTHRVKIGLDFIRWYFAKAVKANQLPEGFATWSDVLNMEKALRERVKRKRDEGESMLTEVAKAQASEAFAFHFGELDRLLHEYPPLLEGRSGLEVKQEIEKFLVELRANSRKKFDQVGEPQKKKYERQ